MLNFLQPRLLSSLRQARSYTQAAVPAAPVPAAAAVPAQNRLAYAVPRNSRGSLPVYTDIRNGGTNRFTLLTHIVGDRDVRLSLSSFLPCLTLTGPSLLPQALLRDLESERVAGDVRYSIFGRDQIRISGFHKNELIAWLAKRGF
ncbi:hypothetical protein A0H81_04430 [Grifola frondosa]|uniref:Large ribosomal subunit protein mL49 n=1 Tax=Grifola frondosa TaxID=5627 RepID=A0A1C7MEI6_GRIFR|nr:hypothetical protein A0H81_04430 [Grifola frondosa]